MNINKIIKESNYIVFFGGAGVSTASGIPDFRSVDGIYNERYEYPPERILSHSFYLSNPEYFYKFYKDKFNLLDKKPNIIHEKLVELEKANKLKCIITQNIDGLHQKAGSKNVLELHGSIYRNYCERCHKFYDALKVFESDGIPKCSCGGIIKPDVVLYEEALSDTFLEAIDKIRESDTLIVAGTSLVVYPASSLIGYFHGKNLILINKEKTPYDNLANIVIHDDLKDIFEGIKI